MRYPVTNIFPVEGRPVPLGEKISVGTVMSKFASAKSIYVTIICSNQCSLGVLGYGHEDLFVLCM